MRAADARGNHLAVGLRGRELHVDGLLASFGGRHEVRQRQVGIRTCHEVHVVVLDEVVLHPFRHAAQDADDESVLLLAAQRVQRLQPVDDFLLRIVAHGACVEEYGVGIFQPVAHLVACHLHDGCHHFAVCHVHLAAVGLDEQVLVRSSGF